MPEPTEPSQPSGALPTFLIVGAQKAGTTALHQYLRVHEETCMSRPKELKFFSSDDNWSRGIDWYASHFATASLGNAIGESCPDYARCTIFPGVPERIASVLPDVKIIYLVREPLERIRSAYQHAVAHGAELRGFDEAVREVPWYLDDTRYAMQLDRYLDVLPPERVLVLSSAMLKDRRGEALDRVADFVGISADRFPPGRVASDIYTSASRKAPPRALAAIGASRSGKRLRRLVPVGLRRRIRASSDRPFDPATLHLGDETVRWVMAELADDHHRLADRFPEAAAWR